MELYRLHDFILKHDLSIHCSTFSYIYSSKSEYYAHVEIWTTNANAHILSYRCISSLHHSYTFTISQQSHKILMEKRVHIQIIYYFFIHLKLSLKSYALKTKTKCGQIITKMYKICSTINRINNNNTFDYLAIFGIAYQYRGCPLMLIKS